MKRLLFLLLLLSVAACASGTRAHGHVDGLRVLKGYDATHTFAVRTESDLAVAGYIVEFFRGPAGSTDERDWPAGTVLVQSPALNTVGFITPGGKAYRYDTVGGTTALSVRGRNAQVAALLGVEPPLEIRSALPGVKAPSAAPR